MVAVGRGWFLMSEVPLYTPRLFWMHSFTSAPVEGWGLGMRVWGYRFRAKREQSKTFQELLSKSQGQNLALTVACVPCSLDSGLHACHAIMLEEVARSICSHISARLAYIQEESGILLASVQIKGRENAIRSSSEGRWPICDRPAMCSRPREGGNACSVACGGGLERVYGRCHKFDEVSSTGKRSRETEGGAAVPASRLGVSSFHSLSFTCTEWCGFRKMLKFWWPAETLYRNVDPVIRPPARSCLPTALCKVRHRKYCVGWGRGVAPRDGRRPCPRTRPCSQRRRTRAAPRTHLYSASGGRSARHSPPAGEGGTLPCPSPGPRPYSASPSTPTLPNASEGPRFSDLWKPQPGSTPSEVNEPHRA